MDIKGDLSGIAAAGVANEKINERCQHLNITFTPSAFPTELYSLSDENGVRLRATVTEFGPILLSKILGLNDTQEGLVSMIFKYCDDNAMPLVDLKDFIKVYSSFLLSITLQIKSTIEGSLLGKSSINLYVLPFTINLLLISFT